MSEACLGVHTKQAPAHAAPAGPGVGTHNNGQGSPAGGQHDPPLPAPPAPLRTAPTPVFLALYSEAEGEVDVDRLEKLALESPQKAEIVKLRYFTGLENKEIARALGISLSTVERSWAYSRSWLHRELKK